MMRYSCHMLFAVTGWMQWQVTGGCDKDSNVSKLQKTLLYEVYMGYRSEREHMYAGYSGEKHVYMWVV